MQEEVNEKVVGLCIKATHMSSDVLKAAMRKYLYEHRQSKQMSRMNRKEQSVPTGKQSLKDLLKQGAELSNIPVTEKNIKDFDRVARKYGIDYSLKRDKSKTPPEYLVFFKARDAEVMTAAFKEYAGVTLRKKSKPSLVQKLQTYRKRAAQKHRERTRQRQKDRGQSR
ncbi:PcfB family protein [uncultured Eubacterium sp.]|uniref:PcfB family protein n=1 Tax=uncultured Eubacterium sp. TaxID=165185 RepID=UPI002596D635|nr:PcfB family protein [uncultured Eubacterium sp.]